MRAYLGVGHGLKPTGAYDPGAISTDGRWSEQSAGDIIVAEAARLLRTWGVEVRDEANGNDPNFAGTAAAANVWNADCVVEVHHDWQGAPIGAFGHWYRPGDKRLADAIQSAVGAAGFPLRPDWHKPRADLYILKHVYAPVTLYEVGRIGQAEIDTPAELQAMGRAIAAGVAAFLGVATEAPTEEVEDMTERDREMLLYAGLWSLEAKLDAARALALAEGRLEDAAVLKGKRAQDIKYWKERWQ